MLNMFRNVFYVVFCVVALRNYGVSAEETVSQANSTSFDNESTSDPQPVAQDTNDDLSDGSEVANNVTTAFPPGNDTGPPETQNTTTSTPPEDLTTTLPVEPTDPEPPEDSTTSTTPPDNKDSNITKYLDETTFLGNLNGWDFYGMWGKYNLEDSSGRVSSIPDLPTSKDHVVLLTRDAEGSFLQKDFPPMFNSTVSLTYFVNCTGSSYIASTVESSSAIDTFFNISGGRLEEVNWQWFTNTYHNFLQNVPFRVKFSFRSNDSFCFWAIDIITIRGNQTSEEVTGPPTNVPPVNPPETTPLTTEEPKNATGNSTTTTEVVPTTQNETTTTSFNETTTEPTPPAPQISTSPPEDTTTGSTTTTVTPNEAVQEIANIASAIWDAFYVFLALFCACLIALIVLIVRQRNREDEPMPPTVAAYSPRTSSYQLEKARDNPGYQTDSV